MPLLPLYLTTCWAQQVLGAEPCTLFDTFHFGQPL